MLARVAALKLETPAGTRFRYSDVGFIVLGELVERLGGMPLDQFAKKHVFDPLRMVDTGFRPGDDLKKRVAPTSKRDGKLIVGEVHDPRSFALGGVAGHAGLFSSADDVARYCRMLLRGGELDGVRVLKPETVKLFTDPQPVPGDAKGRQQLRSRGWDVDTSFSAPRGEVFRGGFGHTGFTGTSVWIDPATLTRRSDADAPLSEAIDQLREYFAGTRRAFTVRLSPRGTPFQQRVWRALCDIPYGEMISYGTLAARIGQPTASRAVGLANGANPLPIIVPCHRVIGANGSLTGYGGGLPIKRQLLALERADERLW